MLDIAMVEVLVQGIGKREDGESVRAHGQNYVLACDFAREKYLQSGKISPFGQKSPLVRCTARDLV